MTNKGDTTMDEKILLALFDRFEASTAVELSYVNGGSSFCLRRKEAFRGSPAANAGSVPSAAAAGSPANGAPAVAVTTSELPKTSAPAPHVASPNAAHPGNEIIKSPIIGTFYRAASPDAPPFADPGMKIKKGQKMCIIEAMKMMNALESEFDCEIVRILVNNGDMVEFDQPLFEVKDLSGR
jgi:acetyl-CoA carboxylase biotin carboxyl carrier protein